jgi:hypothetical protein
MDCANVFWSVEVSLIGRQNWKNKISQIEYLSWKKKRSKVQNIRCITPRNYCKFVVRLQYGRPSKLQKQ